MTLDTILGRLAVRAALARRRLGSIGMAGLLLCAASVAAVTVALPVLRARAQALEAAAVAGPVPLSTRTAPTDDDADARKLLASLAPVSAEVDDLARAVEVARTHGLSLDTVTLQRGAAPASLPVARTDLNLRAVGGFEAQRRFLLDMIARTPHASVQSLRFGRAAPEDANVEMQLVMRFHYRRQP